MRVTIRRSGIACGLAAVIAASGCNPRPLHPLATPSPAATSAGGVPPLRFHEQGTPAHPLVFVFERGGRVLYRLRALSEDGTQRNGVVRAVFWRVTATFFGRNGNAVTARAPRAIVDERTDRVILDGGVQATTGTGLAVRARRMIYDRGTDTLHGEGDVVMTDARGMRVTGTRFDGDLSLAHVVVR